MPSKKSNTSMGDLGIIGHMNCRLLPGPESQKLPHVLIPDIQPGGFVLKHLPPHESTLQTLPISDTDPWAVWRSACQVLVEFEQEEPYASPPWLRPTQDFLDALGEKPS